MAARSEIDFMCGALHGWSPAGAAGQGRKLEAGLCATLYADMDRCARAVHGLPEGAPLAAEHGAVSTDAAAALAATLAPSEKQCDGAVWNGAFEARTPAQACSRVLCTIGRSPVWSGMPAAWDPMPAGGQPPADPNAWTGCDARSNPRPGPSTAYPNCPGFGMELFDVPPGYVCGTLCGDMMRSNTSHAPDPCRGAGCLRPINGRHLPDPVRAFSAKHGAVDDPSYLMMGENCLGDAGGIFPPTCHDMSFYFDFLNDADTKRVLHARPKADWMAGNFWVWGRMSGNGVAPWDNMKALADAGVAVLLYYGKLDQEISAPRGLADLVMMHNYSTAATQADRDTLAAAVASPRAPYAHPGAATSALTRWPADAARAKLGEYALFGKLLFVQIDDAGHEVPVQKPESYGAMLEELLGLPARTGSLAAGDRDGGAACAAAATKKNGGGGGKLSDEGIVAIAVAAVCVVGFVALAWGPGLRTEGTQTPKHNEANGHNSAAPGQEPSLSPARV